jgi:hypothetical protein
VQRNIGRRNVPSDQALDTSAGGEVGTERAF